MTADYYLDRKKELYNFFRIGFSFFFTGNLGYLKVLHENLTSDELKKEPGDEKQSCRSDFFCEYKRSTHVIRRREKITWRQKSQIKGKIRFNEMKD